MMYMGLVDEFHKQHDIAELNAIELLAEYWGTSRERKAKMYPHFLRRVYGDEIPLPDEKFIVGRIVNYLARKRDYWCGSAMVAYANLSKPI